jgi:adenosylhomocysteine nucleosidase
METIGIVAAMPLERQALLRQIEASKRSRLVGLRCDQFQIFDWECWLVTSGMGIRRAGQATRALIEAYHPQVLVSVGVAGAVQADLNIGDVVASRNFCYLENGALNPLQPLAALSRPAWQACEQALQAHQAHLVAGTAVTTDGLQLLQLKPGELSHPILEMEIHGIARAAGEQGLPLLSLRGISDGPNAPLPFDLAAALDEQHNLRVGLIIRTILRHPLSLAQFLRTGRNTNRAAENAALALIAALSQPGPLIL